MLAKFPTAPEILPASTSSRMLETLDVALHFAVPSRKLETKSRRLSVHPVGTTHHDGELVLLGLISDDVGEVFKVTTDDVVGLLVKITVGSIHHVSRSQTIVNPLALFTKSLRNRSCKATTSWRVSCSISKIRSMSKSAFSRIEATSSLGISPTQPMPHQPRFPPQAKLGIYFLHSKYSPSQGE